MRSLSRSTRVAEQCKVVLTVASARSAEPRDAALPLPRQLQCFQPILLLAACRPAQAAAAFAESFTPIVQLSSILDPQPVGLTKAQQRCLSAERRKLSNPAQPKTVADTLEPRKTLTQTYNPQSGSATGAKSLQSAAVRQLPAAHGWSQPCLPQPHAVCRMFF